MVNGVLYTTGGTRRAVIALDARSGELIWVHSMREGKRAAVSPRQLSGRGVWYWTDGKGDERILYVTTGYRLVALNAKTGQPIPSFGDKGIVDLKAGVVKGRGARSISRPARSASTPRRSSSRTSPSSARRCARARPSRPTTTPRASCARSTCAPERLIWQFDTIPRPGQFGNDTWQNESWATNGNVGVWTQITVDEELGLVYLPVETPVVRLLRRASSRQQPVRREPGLRRSQDRQAQVALPVRASPDLELRHVVGADRRRRDRRRQAAQGRGGAEQAVVALRVRPRDGRADLADRREAGADGRRARRVVRADAAASAGQAPLRAQHDATCRTT